MKKKFLYSSGFFVLIFLFVFLILKISFHQAIPDSHQTFIKKKGWELGFYFPKKETFIVPEYPEALQTFQIAGVDFTGHEESKITEHRYRLKQKCDSRYLEAVIFSSNNKIINSYIDIDDTIPGITKMIEVEVYMKRHTCN
jgi:hypothetical protein